MMDYGTETLKNILDFDELEKLFLAYHKATGLSVVLYDVHAEEQLFVRSERCICSFVRERTVCREKLIYSGAKAADLKKSYIYETACGLIMCVTPVLIDGGLVGFITTGPVSLWSKEDFFEEDFLKKCMRAGVDVEDPSFEISDIKQVDCETMTGIADMLMLIVEYMMETERSFRAKRLEMEQFYLELKRNMDRIEDKNEQSDFHKYPVELENELITYVQLGDKANAKSLINDLLAEIFLYAGGDLDIVKAKLYEFMGFFSRAAVEAGAKPKDLTEVVKKSSKLLLENVEFQDICRTTVEILEEYLDVVYKSRGGRPPRERLSVAIEIINEEYGNSTLTLNELAKRMFVSPYYISHLFRDELGITFTDYLTRVRIERAKGMLQDGCPYEEVSVQVGFNDPGYFTKIFKKHVGVTPAKYAGTKNRQS